MTMYRPLPLVLAGALLAGTLGGGAQTAPHESAAGTTPFTLTSPAFADGAALPATSEWGGGLGCHGPNKAPTLTWTNAPAGTRSFALVVVDPDAAPFATGGWVHWIVYNVPGGATRLDDAAVRRSTAGTTSFGTATYGGPCPPATGESHHYIFTLYALRATHLAGRVLTRDALIRAMTGRVLGATSIVGTFRRSL